MSLTLGGIALDPGMKIGGRFASNGVMSMKRTLGGKPIIFAGQAGTGTPLVLSGGDDFGWVDKDDVEALIALSEVPGATYSLQLSSGAYNETFTVIFDHTSGPAVVMEPLVDRIGHADDDKFIGTIKLLVI